MPDPIVVVIGAGPAGIALSLSLARRGRPVTFLERDPDQPVNARPRQERDRHT